MTEAERCNERPQTRIFDAMMSDSAHLDPEHQWMKVLGWLSRFITTITRVAGRYINHLPMVHGVYKSFTYGSWGL